MPENVVIADTSSLIVLSRIKRLDLLNKLYERVSITQEIATEFGEDLPEWICVETVKSQNTLKLLWEKVDLGEASAIALALEKEDVLLIVDDLKARKEAIKLGLKITGTFGIILRCKQNGIINQVKPLIEAMKKASFRISEEVENYILTQSEEK